MHTFHSTSRFIFCTSLIVTLLLGNDLVYGRHLKKRQSPSGGDWQYQANNQRGSGNRLYPTLDFSDPSLVDPGFAPHYHNRLNGTYIPNYDWNNGNVNPNNRYPPVNPNNRYPPVNPNNRYPPYNSSSRYPPVNPNNVYPPYNPSNTYPPINSNNRYPPYNRYPNSNNYSNLNTQNPHDSQLPVGLISENNLPVSRTTCGKTLCSYVANYPTKDIGNAVERAREVLRSGNSNALKNKGLSLESFTSKRNTGSNVSPVPNSSSSCRSNTNAIYPHEGFSSDTNQAYYVVNVPSLAQTINSVECDSKNSQTCNQVGGRPVSGMKTCQQAYRKEQLLVVPFGKNYIDVNDFELRTFHVPAGCYCLVASRPY